MTTHKLFLTLALTALVMGQQKQMVQGPFNATAYTDLMDCVRNASTRYHVAIHSGAVVVIPPEGEAINLESDADSALGSCLDKFSPYLDLAVDDSRICAENHDAVATTQALATVEWAESNGAQGITSQSGTQVNARGLYPGAPGSVALLPRQVTKNYFFSLGSGESDCSSYDQQNNVLNECISFGSPYRSIIFSNPNQYNSIRVRRWPHHKCAVDYDPPGKDGRSVSVPASSDSTCYNYPKQTFSFRGQIIPRSCVGTCQ